MDLAGLQSLEIGDGAAAWNDEVLVREPHVVQHARVRREEAPLARDASLAIEAAHEYIARTETLRLVTVGEGLPGHRVELGMCGERLAVETLAEGLVSNRCERVRIDLVRQPVFLRCVEPAAEDHRRRIRRRAPVGIRNVAHARLVGVRIAIVAIELPPRFQLAPVALRLYVAALVVRATTLDAEEADVTIRRQNRFVEIRRRIEPIEMHAIERAVEALRNLARDLAIVHVHLEPRGGLPSRAVLRKIDHAKSAADDSANKRYADHNPLPAAPARAALGPV